MLSPALKGPVSPPRPEKTFPHSTHEIIFPSSSGSHLAPAASVSSMCPTSWIGEKWSDVQKPTGYSGDRTKKCGQGVVQLYRSGFDGAAQLASTPDSPVLHAEEATKASHR
jgi:hypothetical protein